MCTQQWIPRHKPANPKKTLKHCDPGLGGEGESYVCVYNSPTFISSSSIDSLHIYREIPRLDMVSRYACIYSLGLYTYTYIDLLQTR